jgi:hypothetical protein
MVFCTVFSYRVFLYRDSWWKFFLKRSSPLNCASVCECECDANEQQHRRKREKKISIIKIAKASLLMYLRKKFLCFNCVVFFDNSCDHFPTHSKYFSVFWILSSVARGIILGIFCLKKLQWFCVFFSSVIYATRSSSSSSSCRSLNDFHALRLILDSTHQVVVVLGFVVVVVEKRFWISKCFSNLLGKRLV